MTVETSAAKEEFRTPEGVERTASRAVFRPRVDILETPEAIVLAADMPGVDETNTDITLEKNVLTIKGNVVPVSLEGYTLAYCEYDVGDFERSFTISDEIDRDGIEACVKNGVLRVTLPKAKQASSQKISVSAG